MEVLGGNPSLLYPTSKGAIIQMTRAMAAQHGPENIRYAQKYLGPSKSDSSTLLTDVIASARAWSSLQWYGRCSFSIPNLTGPLIAGSRKRHDGGDEASSNQSKPVATGRHRLGCRLWSAKLTARCRELAENLNPLQQFSSCAARKPNGSQVRRPGPLPT